MPADRLIPNSTTPGAVDGDAFMDDIQGELTQLYDASVLQLGSVGGTADDIEATPTPALTGVLKNGMSFWLTPASTNTGPVTLDVGTGPIEVTNDEGDALGAGVLKAGRRYLVTVTGGVFVAYGSASILKVNDYQVFTTSGTWTKPAGTSDDALVEVEVIAGGGGGGNGSGAADATSGGGGGGCVIKRFRAGDLPSTVAATIGAGGAVGSAGGNSSFGSYLTAYGGGAGTARTSSFQRVASGGAGGGAFRAGANGQSAGANSGDGVSVGATRAGDPTAGAGADASVSTGNTASPEVGGDGYFGGGGGGASAGIAGVAIGADGGASVNGGGGGGGKGTSSGDGGISMFAGNGGDFGAGGAAPGGGGGGNAAGARGEIRIHVTG